MRIETLKSPGVLTNSIELRRQACMAISAAEIYLSTESRQALADFFLDCAAHAAPPKAKKSAPVPEATSEA